MAPPERLGEFVTGVTSGLRRRRQANEREGKWGYVLPVDCSPVAEARQGSISQVARAFSNPLGRDVGVIFILLLRSHCTCELSVYDTLCNITKSGPTPTSTTMTGVPLKTQVHVKFEILSWSEYDYVPTVGILLSCMVLIIC